MLEPVRSPVLSSATVARIRPVDLAHRRVLPVLDALATLLPDGLPRGVTITVTGDTARTATFALGVQASRSGSWLAVIGLADPGWRAIAELGMVMDRVVHVDVGADRSRHADIVAAALDGFDLVLLGTDTHLPGSTERRLVARARERGAVMFYLDESSRAGHLGTGGPFATTADLRVATSSSGWIGLGAGTGRLVGRKVEITAEGRRLAGRRHRATVWLPGPDGTIDVLTAPDVTITTTPPVDRPAPADRKQIGRSA